MQLTFAQMGSRLCQSIFALMYHRAQHDCDYCDAPLQIFAPLLNVVFDVRVFSFESYLHLKQLMYTDECIRIC